MANPKKAVSENVPGEYFVDSTCIDCDACRQIAPATFGSAEASSFVKAQPVTPAQRTLALHALLSCPTGSIGTRGADQPKQVYGDFPLPVEESVYYCGFNSQRSYGGNSYFVQRPEGNWLIDSPRFSRPLVSRLESLGGIRSIFLTHRDDVADAAAYARHFRAQRVIHRDELASQPDAEVVLDGDGPWELADGIQAIATPGHTRGHCVLLVDDRYLFTGDHLAWDRETGHLEAFRDYCWHSWPRQIESLDRLTRYSFDWVLPGHGQRVHLPADRMRDELRRLVAGASLSS
ncbi:MAG: MBL fold metallo-hydrolase [Planctomycetaceae bacterium]|nr:MBL fold metallo-hydrolase [Planctomycetaceae bacterium]